MDSAYIFIVAFLYLKNMENILLEEENAELSGRDLALIIVTRFNLITMVVGLFRTGERC
jgi:hypothetical protein